MSDTDIVTYEVANRVATISMNRPEEMNTWRPEMEESLRAAIKRADADDAVRAIVLTGKGRAFCAGASMQNLSKRAGNVLPKSHERVNGEFDQRYSYIFGIGKPVIAAINGGVAGVGFCLTLYCDIRFMAESAKLSTAFSQRGLVAEHAAAWLLPRLIGPMNAADLLFSSRRVAGPEADKLGYARCLPDAGFLEAVQAYAGGLANYSSPRSLRLMKQQIWESQYQTLVEATHKSEDQIIECRFSEDYKEGSAHYLENRAPNFTGKDPA
ncbi:enoyl-CoA hydratase-related protein [Pseudooceanicola sp.]|uniref:enoyl-CoA hydratase-related protein n=1 Tax=Pseudooceanicola sp. TaxID=1914328 RepID=UPI0026112521|nr:enoyl-CoA hydratase-related protein [Pseudooceanicola sp.]MDF1854064.1 enoyl-CoA hydratase-related protein [Pseudooceanicola sp.]